LGNFEGVDIALGLFLGHSTEVESGVANEVGGVSEVEAGGSVARRVVGLGRKRSREQVKGFNSGSSEQIVVGD